MSSDELRIAALETAVRRLSGSEVAGANTSDADTVNTTAGLTFITPVTVALTKDGTYYTATVSGIPDAATAIYIAFSINVTSTVNPVEYVTIKRNGIEWNMAQTLDDLGSNITQYQDTVLIPSSGGSFQYKIGSDASWTVTAKAIGYFL